MGCRTVKAPIEESVATCPSSPVLCRWESERVRAAPLRVITCARLKRAAPAVRAYAPRALRPKPCLW